MEEEERLILHKKPAFPITSRLEKYLQKYKRKSKIPIFYEDLLRFQGSVVVYDKDDNDTLWVRTYYSEFDRQEIDLSLKKVYNILHSDGNEDNIQFLNIDAIDYCTYANSKPFRVKVRNILNDNYTYFYVKKTDASRIYGLELEHILSPHNLHFLIYQDTLIEEHIAGIPGDTFIKELLPKCTDMEKSQIAKEFVKFNERCMIRLLGDMRSYNYVIVPVHDFDNVIYKIRAIDFDQQSYEGKFKVYRPQFFKENFDMVEMVQDKLQERSIKQYRLEERSMMAKRMLSSQNKIKELVECMKEDHISNEEHISILSREIFAYTKDVDFKKSKNMGDILATALAFVKRNYEGVVSR